MLTQLNYQMNLFCILKVKSSFIRFAFRDLQRGVDGNPTFIQIAIPSYTKIKKVCCSGLVLELSTQDCAVYRESEIELDHYGVSVSVRTLVQSNVVNTLIPATPSPPLHNTALPPTTRSHYHFNYDLSYLIFSANITGK